MLALAAALVGACDKGGDTAASAEPSQSPTPPSTETPTTETKTAVNDNAEPAATPAGDQGAAAPRATPMGKGDQAADFSLVDHSGATVTLAALRQEGPVVAVFYRGDW